MNSKHERLEHLFWRAGQLGTPSERSAFLDEECGEDQALRREVEELLASMAMADKLAEAYQPTLALARLDLTGKTIGLYKLRERIGEGGMGVVYTADQKSPVKRCVALKVIKPGMDSQQVIARFESERQALALMDHPNIAKVLDAGATQEGLPFFVMELVNGVPITRYCDEHRLTVQQRLELMVPVCRAVQHAHQKGIIHRDLKPSNILIAQYDAIPVPKVIDFGVAKAVGSQLGDYSVYTEFGTLVGTLEYMSPEQAQRNQLDIDTRSDIYSLGVVLYELLSGTTPFDGKRLRNAAMDEMLNILRSEEPIRPSLKLSTSGALPEIALSRSVNPDRLSKVVRGELDWIVMKALEKDRSRRYESAHLLEQDLERYLASEPVMASPPSITYRARKFVIRNRVRLAAFLSISLVLMVAAINLSWNAWERTTQAQRDGARLERLKRQVASLMESRDWASALTILEQEATLYNFHPDDLNAVPDNRMRIRTQLTNELNLCAALENAWLSAADRNAVSLGYDKADSAYRNAFAAFGVEPENGETEASIRKLQVCQTTINLISEALADWAFSKLMLASQPASSWEAILGSELPYLDIAKPLVDKEVVLQCRSLLQIADGLDRDPFRVRLRSVCCDMDEENAIEQLQLLAGAPEFARQSMQTRLQIVRSMNAKGLKDQAIAIAKPLQRESPGDFWCNYELAHLLLDETESQLESVRFFTAALAVRPTSTAAKTSLAKAFYFLERFEEAESLYLEALAADSTLISGWLGLGNVRKEMGKVGQARETFEHILDIEPTFAGAWHNIGNIHYEEGNHEEAMKAYRNAIETDPRYIKSLWNLAKTLVSQGEAQKAEDIYRQSIQIAPDYAPTYNTLGLLLRKMGKIEESIECFRAGIKTPVQQADMAKYLQINLGMTLRYWARKDESREAQAIEALKRAVEMDPNWYASHDQLARALANSFFRNLRDPAQAVVHGQLARECVVGKPDGDAGPYVMATLGMAHYRAENWSEAIEALNSPNMSREATGAPPDLFLVLSHWRMGDENTEQQTLFGQALDRMIGETPDDLQLELLREAEELLIEKISKGALEPTFFLHLGLTQRVLRNDSAAIETLRRGIEFDPESAPLHAQLAMVLLNSNDESLRDPSAAVNHARKAFGNSGANGNENTDTLGLLGNTLLTIGQWREALDAFDRSAARSEGGEDAKNILRAKYRNRIARNIRDSGFPEDAVQLCREAIDLGPGFADAYVTLGMTLRYWLPPNEQNEQEAISAYRKCIEIHPKYSPGHDQLSRALANSPFKHLRIAHEAVVHGKRGNDLLERQGTPLEAYACATLGMAYFRAGSWELAINALNQSRDSPGDAFSPTDLFLAMSYWQLGEQDQAKSWYQQALTRIGNAPSDTLEEITMVEAQELIGVLASETKPLR